MKLISNNDINDASVNLALEEYCVRNLDFENEDYILFYINSPSIIIGKHQNTIEEINSEYVSEKNIKVVRRISGGGAVYHDLGNLNFSFLTRHSNDKINNFKNFNQPVIEALNSLGVRAELSGRNDIIVGGRKISGNAQFTNTKAMFSHGTLLFDSNLDDVVKALNVKTDKIQSKGIKSVRSRVANIMEFLEKEISIFDFRRTLLEYIFRDYKQIPFLDIGTEGWKKVNELSDSKYKNWDWNYGRSPEYNIRRTNRFEFGEIDARLNIKDGIINEIKIYGDFLGQGEVKDIEEVLYKKYYKKEEIEKALKNIELNHYFGRLEMKEFTEFICVE